MSNEVGYDQMGVAHGIYINYLETNSHIFLPQFGQGYEAKDAIALQMFRDLFAGKNKSVVPVYSQPISERGGVLNCITWN